MAFNPSHAGRMRDALGGSGRVVQIGMQMNSGQGIQKLDSDLSANHRAGADAESETAWFLTARSTLDGSRSPGDMASQVGSSHSPPPK
jgi:hypothetical protein